MQWKRQRFPRRQRQLEDLSLLLCYAPTPRHSRSGNQFQQRAPIRKVLQLSTKNLAFREISVVARSVLQIHKATKAPLQTTIFFSQLLHLIQQYYR
jgi:hypothetical protein